MQAGTSNLPSSTCQPLGFLAFLHLGYFPFFDTRGPAGVDTTSGAWVEGLESRNEMWICNFQLYTMH